MPAGGMGERTGAVAPSRYSAVLGALSCAVRAARLHPAPLPHGELLGVLQNPSQRALLSEAAPESPAPPEHPRCGAGLTGHPVTRPVTCRQAEIRPIAAGRGRALPVHSGTLTLWVEEGGVGAQREATARGDLDTNGSLPPPCSSASPPTSPSSLLRAGPPGPPPALFLPPTLWAVLSSSPAIWAPTAPPKKKRSVVLDAILEQLGDSEDDSEEQTLQLRAGTERVRGSGALGTGDGRAGSCVPTVWAGGGGSARGGGSGRRPLLQGRRGRRADGLRPEPGIPGCRHGPEPACLPAGRRGHPRTSLVVARGPGSSGNKPAPLAPDVCGSPHAFSHPLLLPAALRCDRAPSCW